MASLPTQNPPSPRDIGPPPRPAQVPVSLLQTGAQASLKGAAAEAENLEAIKKAILTRVDKARIARRPGRIVKPASTRSIKQLPLQIRPTEATVPAMPGGEELINVFRVQKARQINSNSLENEGDSEKKSRVSYTREQKLAAIAYYETTFVENKFGDLKQISKYAVCQNLDITETMLSKWKKNKPQIEGLKKGTRKERSSVAHEPELEYDLMKQFIELRSLGRRVTRSWFTRCAKKLYKERYPERVTRINNKDVFTGLQFSYGWFCGFRKRQHIATRRPTKKAQEAAMPSSFY